MREDVAAYVEAIDAERRPLFDRVHGLVRELFPDADLVLSYKMPTWVAGKQRLHVGVWKHGLSFYGWRHGRDGGLAARHPHLDNGRGTLRLPVADAAGISDDELRGFLEDALRDPGQQAP